MRINFANKKVSSLLCLAAMFFWGSLFPMIKLGYAALDINTSSPADILLFAGVRFTICGVILLAITYGRNRQFRLPDAQSFRPILLVALLAYVLHYTCTYIGLSHLESSKTALIKQVGTLFIVCFAFLFRREDTFTAAKLIGGILGFLGIIVININGLQFSMNGYDLLIIGASLCTVLSTILSKNAYDHCDPMVVTSWAQLAGGVTLLALGAAMGGRIGRFDLTSFLTLAYICFASCMGYSLWNVLIKYNNISQLNLIKFTEALFSALCSWILLGENIFRPVYLISLILMCLGLLIGTGTLKRKGTSDKKDGVPREVS